jgi:hypothetical protein
MGTPAGWTASGKAPQDYDFDTDKREVHSGAKSARMRSKVDRPSGFGTLMQEFIPDRYRGHRVRLSGWIKTQDVKGWCGLWLRADGADQKVLAFDGMQHRPIRGTNDWKCHNVVLDIPAATAVVAFGMILDGAGTAWLDDVMLEVVTDDVPLTSEGLPHEPQNLNFEKR